MSNPASPLLYSRLVPLDRQRHATLRLAPATDLSFAARSPMVPLLAAEFAHAAREYPVVFVRPTDQELVPVVITGTPEWGNVFVNSEGRWDARYVPAYVRRYPFVFARTDTDQLAVCIDDACPRFGTETGTPLFQNGEPSPLLQEVLTNLEEYERHAHFTASFMKKLDAAGILMEANARAEIGGQSLALRGFLAVDEARFRALPPATVQEWFASGELGLVYAHLISLANLLQVVNRHSAQAGAAGLKQAESSGAAAPAANS